jgi:hypothetical protein
LPGALPLSKDTGLGRAPRMSALRPASTNPVGEQNDKNAHGRQIFSDFSRVSVP